MLKTSILVLCLFALGGCAALPSQAPYQASVSPCAVSEASYACQVERYQNVNVP